MEPSIAGPGDNSRASTPKSVPLCGDLACPSPGCSKEALDAALNAWDEEMERNARAIVRGALGLPARPGDAR